MNCSICNLLTGDVVGSVLPQCKCGWQKTNSPVTQRTWVGLTDEEIYTEARNHEKFAKDGREWFDRGSFARAIETKFKEKNT